MDNDVIGWVVLLCALATIVAVWQWIYRFYLFASKGTPLGVKKRQVMAFFVKLFGWIIFCTLITRVAVRTWADALVWGSVWAWLVLVSSYCFPYGDD